MIRYKFLDELFCRKKDLLKGLFPGVSPPRRTLLPLTTGFGPRTVKGGTGVCSEKKCRELESKEGPVRGVRLWFWVTPSSRTCKIIPSTRGRLGRRSV